VSGEVQVLASFHDTVRGLAIVLGIELVAAIVAWGVLKLTTRMIPVRVVLLFALLAGHYVAVLQALTLRETWTLGLFFIWIYGVFFCRFLSSIYYYARFRSAPGLWFHIVLLIWGPRQHYGVGSWDELTGKPFSGKLLRNWGRHLAYEAAVIAIVAGLAWGWVALQLPYRKIALSVALFLIGLEILEFMINLQLVSWSFSGRFPGFLGRFAMFRAVHIGQWWQYWNVPAVVAFREVSRLLGYPRSRFVNVMAVFVTSGILHQILVYCFTRRPSYGTMLSFLVHGLLVYLFTGLYYRRERIPRPLRLLIFNQLTSLVFTVLAGLPFILDFLGWFRL
jgi:hypothetical protein